MTPIDRGAVWLAGHPRVVDVTVAAGVVALFEMPAFDPYRHDSRHWWPLWGVLIAGSLLWRRRRPSLVLAIALAGTAAALLTRSGPNWGALSEATIFVGPAVALGTAGASRPRPTSKCLALAAGGSAVAITVATGSAPDALVAQLVILGGAWATGEAFRARRHEIVLLHDLVSSRAQQAAADERNRIARDIHDVIAHQLAVIAIQAGAARVTADPDSSVVDALATIEQASQTALNDIRRVLGVLRDDRRRGRAAPQPGLGQLQELARRLRRAGLPVEIVVCGDVGSLPPGLSLTVYRIIQEALTNVLNHAGAVATQVRLVRSVTGLQLEVRNDPPPTRPPRRVGGQGLLGMRERVVALRGTLETGPMSGGGFAITAHIPLS